MKKVIIMTGDLVGQVAEVVGFDNFRNVVTVKTETEEERIFKYDEISPNGYILQGHVEFVSYTGKFPGLCQGTLTLRINGKEVKFGNIPLAEKSDYPAFWETGGTTVANGGAFEGRWRVNTDKLPDCYKPYAVEIADIMNSRVELGCCGGCFTP